MKKNININFFGTLYAIDEDAYELLNRYINDIKKYFSGKEGGEEISDDIEHRIAEVMQELKAEGKEPISIELVKEIIARIGKPEELCNATDEEEGENSSKAHRGKDWFTKHISKKKLYRNPDDKMLCGVLSGIGCYAGIDPLWLRLALIILTIVPLPFISVSLFSALLVYFLFALIIPEANTPEERLRMQGKPVTMETLNEEIVGNADGTNNTNVKNSKRGSLFDVIIRICVILIKCLLVIFLGWLLFGGAAILLICTFVICLLSFAMYGHPLELASRMVDADSILLNFIGTNGYAWISGVAFIIATIIFIYLVAHCIARLFNKGKSMGRIMWVYICMFFGTLILGCVSFYNLTKDISTEEDRILAFRESQRYQTDIDREKEWLKGHGWEVIAHEHGDHYVKMHEHYSGDYSKQYIDTHSNNPNMVYTLERSVRTSPGIYTLEAAVRTDGAGPEIYAYNYRNDRLSTPFPVYAQYGGEIWEEATKKMNNTSTVTDEVKRLAEAHHGKGYGWSRIRIENIEVKNDSIIRYGVTNRSGGTGYWNGTWFSAADFKLIKVQ